MRLRACVRAVFLLPPLVCVCLSRSLLLSLHALLRYAEEAQAGDGERQRLDFVVFFPWRMYLSGRAAHPPTT